MSPADAFAQILADVVRKAASEPFLLAPGRRVTFGEFASHVEDWARQLRPFPPRSLAAVCFRRPVDFVQGYFGCLLAGLVPVPLSPLLKERDLRAQTQGCSVLLTDTKSGTDGFQRLEGTPWPLQDEEVAVLLTTSGTTRGPRRVALSLANVVWNARAVAAHLRSGPGGPALAVLPLCHSFAHTTQMWAQLLTGAPLVLTGGPFLPRQFLDLLGEYQVATTGLVAQSLRVLRELLGNPPRRTADLPLKLVLTGSVLDLGLLEYASLCFPRARLIQGYGLTEASPRVSMEPLDEAPRVVRGIRSSGPPLPGVDVRVVDPDRGDVGPPEEGEIHVRGPGVLRGYLESQALTRATDESGWLPTGDTAFRDEDGWLYVLGRNQNAFLHRGFRLFPEEIEAYVLEDPRVLRCRALSREGRYVVEIESTQLQETTPVLERFRRELPYWKIPDAIVLTELPTSHTDKVLRHRPPPV